MANAKRKTAQAPTMPEVETTVETQSEVIESGIENKTKAVETATPPQSKAENTLEQRLEAFLDRADREIKTGKALKEQRAKETMSFLSASFTQWQNGNRTAPMYLLLKRSEFASLIRVILGHVTENVTVTGRGKNMTIAHEGDTVKFVKAQVKVVTDFANKEFRIDDSEVKEHFGIFLTEYEIAAKIFKAISGIPDKKFNGDKASDRMTDEQRKALEHCIALFAPKTKEPDL